MDQTTELPRHHERTSHLRQNLRHNIEPRKKFHVKNFIKKAATVGLTVGGIALAAEGLLKAIQFAEGENIPPNAFLNGQVEINMSDNLNVRRSPSTDSGIKINWNQIEQVKTKGDEWISLEGGKGLTIKMPAIYRPNDLHPEDTWITLDAKVNESGITTEEMVYVNADPNKTGEYVKGVQQNQIYSLNLDAASDWTGTISVQH